ncbi:hypothetical protein HDU67_004715 [Dinochytrium kinnereticum]|nr:hypothetical protein HDU67_004715 [Dinochytrium kinnereticum]
MRGSSSSLLGDIVIPNHLTARPPRADVYVSEGMMEVVGVYVGHVERIRGLMAGVGGKEEEEITKDLQKLDERIQRETTLLSQLMTKQSKDYEAVKRVESGKGVRSFAAKLSGRLDKLVSKEQAEFEETGRKVEKKRGEVENAKEERERLCEMLQKVKDGAQDLKNARKDLIHFLNEVK